MPTEHGYRQRPYSRHAWRNHEIHDPHESSFPRKHGNESTCALPRASRSPGFSAQMTSHGCGSPFVVGLASCLRRSGSRVPQLFRVSVILYFTLVLSEHDFPTARHVSVRHANPWVPQVRNFVWFACSVASPKPFRMQRRALALCERLVELRRAYENTPLIVASFLSRQSFPRRGGAGAGVANASATQ